MVIKNLSEVNRKVIKEDRIAICPQFGCSHIEKIKPLKLGFIGFRKYPKCSIHKYPLVFVDQFIDKFIRAVKACVLDRSSCPPEKLLGIVKTIAPDDLIPFINGWMYCIPFGRGAQIAHHYLEGLSRGYIKLLSRKQRKIYKSEKYSKVRSNNILLKGLERIGEEYATFLRMVNQKTTILYDPKLLKPLSKDTSDFLEAWFQDQRKIIQDIVKNKSNHITENNESLIILKKNYDIILQAGICLCLMGRRPNIVTKNISIFELFSAYYEFLESGLTNEWSKCDLDMINNLEILELDEKEINKKSSPKNFNSFKQEVLGEIEKIIIQIKADEVQSTIIFENSLELLLINILKAEKGLISIPKNANPLTHAAAIVYTILRSNNDLPKIKGAELYKLVGISNSPFYVQYKNYKSLLPHHKFDFNVAKLGKTRRNVSLYFFKIMLNHNIKLSKLESHLNNFSIPDLVLHFREIFLNNHELTQEEQNLKKQINKKISVLKDMAINYSETFDKYFSDLANIVKHLLISSKFHKIIQADFSTHHFCKFLVRRDINLFNKQETLEKAILDIMDFLREKFSNFFPEKTKTGENWGSAIGDKGHVRRRVVGSRIKLYIMKNIYEGRYFDKIKGISICPECIDEGFTINTSFPRIRSKEFHHNNLKIEGYSVNELYDLFLRDRGNPFFLRDLARKMEEECVVLICGSHHSILKAIHFNNFKKLISWEHIPKEFPYKDIFDLPAEIIHILVKICVDNFPLHEPLPGHPIVREQNIDERRLNVRKYVIDFLKERYTIDNIHGGICPICGEFNTKDHLPAFEYSHLYKISELTPEERKKREKYTMAYLYRTFTCSEIAKEMEKIYQKGGYLCSNCHRVIHKDMSIIDKVYDEPDMLKKILKDNEKTIRKHKANLVYYRESIKNPLKPQRDRHVTFMEYLIALYEISTSKKKQDGVTRKEIKNYLGLGTISRGIYVFENREVSRSYLKIVGGSPIKYFITVEGKRIVRLMYYFRDYYKNLFL